MHIRLGSLIPLFLLLFVFGSEAFAGICSKGRDFDVSDETANEENYYRTLFPESAYFGNRRYNRIILECNRKRDSKGNEIQKGLGNFDGAGFESLLDAPDLDWKVIRGKYNFFGTLATQQKYIYALRKKGGQWEMIIPYNASINDIVKNRVDFLMGRRAVLNADNNTLGPNNQTGPAWDLYEADQVDKKSINGNTIYELKSGASPIAETLCSTSTYFSKKDKYTGQHGFNASKRDHANKHIDLGLIQYRYKRYDDPKNSVYSSVVEGCRVADNMDLYWVDPDDTTSTTIAKKVKPKQWIFDNFIKVAEEYWSTPANFTLRLWLKGYNDQAFTKAQRDQFESGDHLTVYFATKFMGNGSNQMYKSNPIQFNNFSTMTTDGTYRHEVGHAFGLDDEYSKKKKADCDSSHYSPLGSPRTVDYMMCGGYDSGLVTTIYHYIAISRYGTRQKECKSDNDCKNGEWCDAGVDLKKNMCRDKLEDGSACPLVGGGHACKSNHCKFGKCYTPGSIPMGGACFTQDQCAEGKCNNAVDGTPGTCVCKFDSDCGQGRYCDGGVDLKINQCRDLKADNTACALIDGGRTCQSGRCKLGRCYTANSVQIGGTCYVNDACRSGRCSSVNGTRGQCVCNDDNDCGSNSVCKTGTLGVGLNRCVATRTPSCPSGWSYEVRNPLNKDRCNRTTTSRGTLKCKLAVTDKAKNWTGPHAKTGADECRSKKGKKPKGVKCSSGYKYTMKSGADSCTKTSTDHQTPTCPSGWNYKSQSGRDICEDT